LSLNKRQLAQVSRSLPFFLTVKKVVDKWLNFYYLQHAKVSRENRLKILHESIGPENIPNLEVRLPDADPKAFRLVLDFIYTDQIDPTKNKKEDANSDEVCISEKDYSFKNFFSFYKQRKIIIDWISGCSSYDASFHAVCQVSHGKIRAPLPKIYRGHIEPQQCACCP